MSHIREQLRGVPVKVKRTGTLTWVGRIGHRLDVIISVVASMPVVGGRIAKLIAGQVTINMQGEGDFAVQWVETHEEWGAGRWPDRCG